MLVTKAMVDSAPLLSDSPRFDADPLQTGMGRAPWRVAVCSMLLCRARYAQASPVLQALLARWPNAAFLARADTDELESVVRPCGFQRNRARQLARFSVQYLGDAWQDLRELSGVGAYVSDAVGLFCFDLTELECTDHVLRAYAVQVRDRQLLQDAPVLQVGPVPAQIDTA